MKSFFNEISKFNVKRNVSLVSYNTFKIDSKAKILIEASSENVVEIISILKKFNKKYILLGAGSNTVFRSKVVKKIVVVLADCGTIKQKNNSIICGAGERLSNLVLYYLKNGYGGLEWAAGIPASVGGATIMNAGAFNGSMSDVIKKVCYYDGEQIRCIKAKECGFLYRNSLFKQKGFIVLSVELKFSVLDKQSVLEVVNRNLQVRKQKQPSEPSAGSIFKNGEGFSAGALIEGLGMKGKVAGGAAISSKHANFIVNYKGATGKDVVKLIKQIKKLAKIKYNATLCEEVVIQ